jgi:aspartate kinase
MNIIVQKYGGTSLANLSCIKNVATNVINTWKNGFHVVVVVSAMSGETNRLINLAKSLDANYQKRRELDVLLSTGEQVTASLLSIALNSNGIVAKSYCGWQIPFYTSDDFTEARINQVDTKQLLQDLEENKIIVVTGFQGVSIEGDITTLGRGGSDTSAVALAIALNAIECQIYTDVNGVYNADPNKITIAKRIEIIDGEYMLESASLGAKVLHVRSCELAYRYKVNLRVLSSFAPADQGSLIMNKSNLEDYPIISISSEEEQVLVKINIVENIANLLEYCYRFLPLDMLNISQNLIQFVIKQSEVNYLKNIMHDYSNKIDLHVTHNLAKISLIGSGFRSNNKINQRLWQQLINYEVFLTTHNELSVSILVHNFDVISIRNQLSVFLD